MLSIAAIGRGLVHWRLQRLDRGCHLPDWHADKPDSYCPRCGASCGPGGLTARGCAFCIGTEFPWHRLTRLGIYAPPLDEAIKAMKFARHWSMAGYLGRQLAQSLRGQSEHLVCPVPLHRFRGWSRGYNQSQLMAEALAAELHWPMLPMLKRVRHTPPQSTLPPSRRISNLRSAFSAYPVDLAGCDVLLVDDVKTTGSTLRACAMQLKQCGARTIHCAVAAVADPKGHGFTTI